MLDEPGEWYLDRRAKTVYYMPRPGEDMTKLEVIAPGLEKLVELRGTLDQPVHNIRFVGIAFRHGNWLRPSKIGHCEVQANFIIDSDRKDSFVRDGGLRTSTTRTSRAPPMWSAMRPSRSASIAARSTNLAARDWTSSSARRTMWFRAASFYDISGSAVQIGDVLKDDHHPDDPRKIVKNNSVVNCYIHDCAVEYMGGVGVFAGYTEGTRIVHNEICRMPYSGISVGWGWGEEDAGGGGYQQPFFYNTPTPAKNNHIEMNHIHRRDAADADGGAIYTLGNQPGTVIRGNHIHDNPGFPGGIYLDEGSGFIEITGNLVYNVGHADELQQRGPEPQGHVQGARQLLRQQSGRGEADRRKGRPGSGISRPVGKLHDRCASQPTG